MIRLALRSLRADRVRFLATFVTILLSTAMAAAFATLLETALEPMAAMDREILVILGGVIGGWGAIIGTFAPVSTLAMVVQRRTQEVDLLRELGATPRQVSRLVRIETTVIAVMAAGLGALAAAPIGRVLFRILQDGGMVAAGIDHRAGPLSLGTIAAVMVVLAAVSASLATRSAARRTAGDRAGVLPQPGSLPRWRRITGWVLVGFGVCGAQSGITMSLLSDDPYLPMQIAGPAGLLAAAGLATLAPWVLRRGPRVERVLGAGAVRWLAGLSISTRPELMAPVLGPVMLLVAGATGTLMLVGIDARTASDLGGSAEQAESLILLNTAVAVMITVFTAILAVNAQNAVTSGRSAEFARLRLAGATARQVRGLVTAESLLVGGLGSIIGSACALLTVVPMSWTRGEGVLPDAQWWLPLAVAGAATLLTVVAGRFALARFLRLGPQVPAAAR